MNTFQIQLAGKIIELSAQYPYLLTYCSEYLVTGTPDLSIAVQPADIAFEREKSRREDLREGIPVREFSDDCLEATAAYRKIADALLAYDILVFHGSAVAVDGVGYLFTAKSGTGKSTHTALWQTYFGERAVRSMMISRCSQSRRRVLLYPERRGTESIFVAPICLHRCVPSVFWNVPEKTASSPSRQRRRIPCWYSR